MEQYLKGDAPLLFFLALCWGFNLIYTAVSNARKEKDRNREPFVRIDATINDLRVRMDNLERRVDAHDADLNDLHAGQSALCRGVQALLDHELHNGNESEMQAASDSIGKWLRNR